MNKIEKGTKVVIQEAWGEDRQFNGLTGTLMRYSAFDGYGVIQMDNPIAGNLPKDDQGNTLLYIHPECLRTV